MLNIAISGFSPVLSRHLNVKYKIKFTAGLVPGVVMVLVSLHSTGQSTVSSEFLCPLTSDMPRVAQKTQSAGDWTDCHLTTSNLYLPSLLIHWPHTPAWLSWLRHPVCHWYPHICFHLPPWLPWLPAWLQLWPHPLWSPVNQSFSEPLQPLLVFIWLAS